MAARGSESKEKITQKLLETFEGAFKYDKEIRIPLVENGEEIQIKVTLTAAKTNVEHGADMALPGEKKTPTPKPLDNSPSDANNVVNQEPSAEEKANLEKIIAAIF